MRDRLEDLGRVLVLSEKLLEHPLFQELYWYRAKEANDWFERQTLEIQQDVIHEYAYGIEGIKSDLSEIVCICRGHDDLAENTK